MKTEWLRNAIIEGFQGLMALNLQNSPTVDATKAMVSVWLVVLHDAPVAWDEATDRQRVRAAFRKLARTATRWPVPADFFAALERRPEPLKLAAPVGKHTEESKKMIADLLQRMRA